MKRVPVIVLAAIAGGVAPGAGVDVRGAGRPEAVADAGEPAPARSLYFGDLHVHTSYSFDSYSFGTRADPVAAYEGARASLDFAAVTDHSEYLGETELCTVPGSPGYETRICESLRGGAGNVLDLLRQLCKTTPPVIDPALCADAAAEVWQRMQDVANAAYVPNEFTTFIAYEYTLGKQDGNRHRNVIFAGANVMSPVTAWDHTPRQLWQALVTGCLAADGCRVLAIPHTSNASRGTAFTLTGEDGEGYMSVAEATLRAQMEPLAEIFQHTGNSECYPGVNTTDEECEYEKLPLDRVTKPPGGSVVPKGSFVREALKLGLRYEDRFGVNPYRLGFIGSTDTHNSTAGKTGEATFSGHAGSKDDTIEKRLETDIAAAYGPGGLVAAWATANTREAIFAALQRREVYATSGTRPVARFFGGWSYAPNLCANPLLVPIAYRDGVPMGAVLPSPAGARPIFVVQAQSEALGAPLRAVQIVKGWTSDGEDHESVTTIVEAPTPAGSQTLCEVWTDESFVAGDRAFYYARVLEVATPRWSAYDCANAGVDCEGGAVPPGLERCCDGTMPASIEERAWTSPIWYLP
jgi:hypothetical protein